LSCFAITDFQDAYDNFFKTIDALKAFANISSVSLLQQSRLDLVQQSCALEGNNLGLAKTETIWKRIKSQGSLDSRLSSPFYDSDECGKDYIEIKNCLLATHFIHDALEKSIELGIKKLNHIIVRDRDGKGGGEFRKDHVEMPNPPITVYPVRLSLCFVIFMCWFIKLFNTCISFHRKCQS
jgi:hypothetical protein